MISKIVQKAISYKATVSNNISYSFKAIGDIVYTVVATGISAFRGRLGYYDGIDLGRLDTKDLEYLDTLEEVGEHTW